MTGLGWSIAGMVLAGVATVAPVAASPSALNQWIGGDDALLVVMVLEGLRADALDAARRDGHPVMAATTALADRSLRFDDVIVGAPHPAAGAFEMLSGAPARAFLQASAPWTDGFTRLVTEGFTPLVGGTPPADLEQAFGWLFLDPAPDLETFLARLREAGTSGGRHLALWFSSDALPPYALTDAQLDATDPRPGADAPPNATIDELMDRRRATARAMTRTLRTGQSLSTRRHAEDFRWVAEAAAAAADESVARVTAVLEETRAWPRASLIVTSSCGTGLGDRGVVGAACGVDLGQVAVPLVWYLPGAEPARSPFPAQLSDLASTLTLALDPTDPREGWGLFSGAPHDRTRTSLAWFTRAGRPQAAYRLTTDALTLLVDSAGEATLFDRGWDRGEYTDLSARQAPLVRRQRTELVRRLWGTAPQLWILVKGGADDLVSGVVRGRGLAPAPPVGLEPLDAVKESEGRLAFSLVADEADVLKIALPAEFESLVVEIQSPRSRTPVVLGPKAAEWSLRPIAMGPFAPAALQAFAGTQPPDPVRWLAERPATLAVWLVGSEAGSGP